MDKKDIERLAGGKCTPQEAEGLYHSMAADPQAKELYASLKSRHVFSSLRGAGNRRPPLSRRIFYAVRNVAAVLFLPLLLLAGYVFYSQDRELKEAVAQLAQPLLKLDNSETLIRQYAENGVKSRIVLADGSHIWLNGGSSLEYPAVFNGKTRDVYLSGEAAFDVATDSLHPMVIHTPDEITAIVRGTEFNIKSYPKEGFSLTMLRGKLELQHAPTSQSLGVGANEVVMMDMNSRLVKNRVPEKESKKKTVWKDGVLVFDNLPMAAAIRDMERWYGVEVTVKDRAIYDNHFTAVFQSEALVTLLETLKITSGINYKLQGNQVELFLH